jgi:hypothetical protein
MRVFTEQTAETERRLNLMRVLYSGWWCGGGCHLRNRRSSHAVRGGAVENYSLTRALYSACEVENTREERKFVICVLTQFHEVEATLRERQQDLPKNAVGSDSV